MISVPLGVGEAEILISLIERELETFADTVRSARANSNVQVVERYTELAAVLLELRNKIAPALTASQ